MSTLTARAPMALPPLTARSPAISIMAAVAVLAFVACVPTVRAEGSATQERDIAELQFGAGTALATTNDVSPMVQVHARYSYWRTIGLGVYAGGMWSGSSGNNRVIVPLCLRANLSLPFWEHFEPMASLGLGAYFGWLDLYDGTHTSATPGGHAALSLLFPGARWGFGAEAAVHVFGDIQYPSEVDGMETVAVTVLFR